MRAVFLLSLLASFPNLADKPAPTEIKAEDLAILASDKDKVATVAVLKEYHGKELRLTGNVTWSDSQGFSVRVAVPNKPKAFVSFPIRFADDKEAEAAKKTIQSRASRNQTTSGTLIGVAAFAVEVEKPSPDYVVPKELQPKPSRPSVTETLQQTQDRLQRELVEEAARQEAILQDARRKKQTVMVTEHGNRGLGRARVEKRGQ